MSKFEVSYDDGRGGRLWETVYAASKSDARLLVEITKNPKEINYVKRVAI